MRTPEKIINSLRNLETKQNLDNNKQLPCKNRTRQSTRPTTLVQS